MAWNGGGSGLKLGSADLLKFGAGEEVAAALRSSSARMTLMCPFNVIGSADIGSELGAEEGAAALGSTSSAPLTLKCPFKVIGSRAVISFVAFFSLRFSFFAVPRRSSHRFSNYLGMGVGVSKDGSAPVG